MSEHMSNPKKPVLHFGSEMGGTGKSLLATLTTGHPGGTVSIAQASAVDAYARLGGGRNRGMAAVEDAHRELLTKAGRATPFIFDVGASMEHSVVVGPSGAGMSVADYFATETAKGRTKG